MNPQYQVFLTEALPKQLRELSPDQAPNFGLMSPHHMVEHLIFVTKSMMKRRGEPEAEMNKSQLYFRKFIDNGCPFEHRPKEDAALNDIRTANLEEAIQALESANSAFYDLWEKDAQFKSYNPMTGELSLVDIELFNYQHGRWHLHQFGLIEEFTVVDGSQKTG